MVKLENYRIYLDLFFAILFVINICIYRKENTSYTPVLSTSKFILLVDKTSSVENTLTPFIVVVIGGILNGLILSVIGFTILMTIKNLRLRMKK